MDFSEYSDFFKILILIFDSEVVVLVIKDCEIFGLLRWLVKRILFRFKKLKFNGFL